jgi:hypothetical protein
MGVLDEIEALGDKLGLAQEKVVERCAKRKSRPR